MRRSPRVVVLAVLTALAACGTADPPAGSAEGGVSGEVTVFAAASLTETFTELGKRFEKAHPGTTVTVNFGASSALAKQITEGAPADVFASASPANMAQVTDAGAAAGDPTTFARNRLVIAVPAGNPGGVTGLDDFADPGRKIALCAEQVPCGAAARKALDAAGVSAEPDTFEQDVKAALTKVSLGEVDAALVYTTDVRAAGDDVEGIEFPEAGQAINDYPIVVCKDAPNAGAATAFVDLVRSARGRAVLSAAGFEEP
ncbi:molybdate ABC transporter substrate-binding protein [Actinophytocola sp.]|uniref:molybdate ABC transporter substrate-binding protein n=1 Tax=Actinophytocola sp. TaxID=1872138 RepID=UPI003D6B587D